MTARHLCTDERPCTACEAADRSGWDRVSWHTSQERRQAKTRRMWLFVTAVVVGTGLLIAAVLLIVAAGGLDRT